MPLSIPDGQAYAPLIGEKPLLSDEEDLGQSAGASAINTTRSNIKHAGAAAPADAPDAAMKAAGPAMAARLREAGASEADKDESAGIAIKEQGVKVDGAAAPEPSEPAAAAMAKKEQGPATDAGAAMPGDPVPDIDYKLGQAQDEAAAAGPVRPTPTDPGDPTPPGGGPGGGGEVAASGQPIPGVDVIVKKKSH
ncbi:MAG: hypothetical protein QOH36_924 [Actinomycetota bacterium]|nr:hypothetical protein [Actinomycetota bacterium]MEA2972730.1 hypothetical protein [Actinomycetota bacterium]